MKRLFLAGLFLGALMCRADVTLVSKLEQSSPMGPGKMRSTITQKIRGKKVRTDVQMLDIPAGQGDSTTIYDGETGTMIMLMHGPKIIQRISASGAKEQKEFFEQQFKAMGQDSGGRTERPKLTATGRKQEINGYQTEEYIAESSTFKIAYWLAPSLARLVPLLAQLAAAVPQPMMDRMPDPAAFPGVPIRMSMESTMPMPAGPMKSVSVIDTIKITEEPLPDADFAVPSGYRENRRR